MRKNDIILISVIMAVAVAALVGMRLWQMNNTRGTAVAVVTVDGALYGTYPLSEDVIQKIDLLDGTYNVLVISDGCAEIKEASCPDQICVKHNRIRYNGESIVCLPNKLVVEIKGGEDNGIDASTY